MAGQAVIGAGGTVIGTNVLVPVVGYTANDLLQLPAMSVEVQVSVATILAAVLTVACMAVRTLWRRKFGEIPNDQSNSAGA